MIRLSNDIIDKAIAQHDHPREQLQQIVMQAAQMGERFHFFMHASGSGDGLFFLGVKVTSVGENDVGFRLNGGSRFSHNCLLITSAEHSQGHAADYRIQRYILALSQLLAAV